MILSNKLLIHSCTLKHSLANNKPIKRIIFSFFLYIFMYIYVQTHKLCMDKQLEAIIKGYPSQSIYNQFRRFQPWAQIPTDYILHM
jgi:hypothetical protein